MSPPQRRMLGIIALLSLGLILGSFVSGIVFGDGYREPVVPQVEMQPQRNSLPTTI